MCKPCESVRRRRRRTRGALLYRDLLYVHTLLHCAGIARRPDGRRRGRTRTFVDERHDAPGSVRGRIPRGWFVDLDDVGRELRQRDILWQGGLVPTLALVVDAGKDEHVEHQQQAADADGDAQRR